MKIAFLSYDFPEYCIRHANAMSADHQVLLMLPGNVAEEYRHLLEPAVHYEPFHRPRYRQPFRQLATVIRILHKVRAYKPDVVHFQNGHLYFNLALSLLKKCPLIITIHDPRQHLGDDESNLTPQALMDYGFKKADRVIVHGTALKPLVVNELGFKDHLVHVIPHVAIGDRKIDVPVTDDGNTLLFFGRIWEYKGLAYLIRAEPKISAEFPNLRIVIGGQGQDFDRYRRIMVHPDRFEVHNEWIGADQRARLFAAASIVVLPYVEATQSGVIPVAYTYAKPVIATRTGGLPDMVEHGHTGLLVPPRDSDALAEAVIALLRNEPRRLAMGRAGRDKLQRECSPQVVTRQTLDVYRETINDRYPARQPRPSAPDISSQTPSTETMFEQAAKRIHGFLADQHVVDGALIGPDPGVRFNYRFWRFFKSSFPRVNWNDDLYYLQAQGYWILANWMLSQANGDSYEEIALAATNQVLQRQRDDGAWDYPNPEWKGRVATVEGIWASLGLMESYRRSGETMYLEAAIRWHAFFESKIGFQDVDGNIAVNYFANTVDKPVPNNSALALRFLANMSDTTGDPTYLEKCDGLLQFIRRAQLPSGEVPYVYGDSRGVHFQCFQYQAFMYLDVREYFRLTGDQRAKDVLVGILGFLKNGISAEGFAYYQCGEKRRTVNYHTCAVASSLASGGQFGVPDCDELAERAFRYLLRQQRPDGSIPHSRGDYYMLRDCRAYPRYLAMMILHLLGRPHDDKPVNPGKETCDAIAHV